MDIAAIGISHENVPLSVREKFSFTKKKQAALLEYITENIADEAVIVSTCNRCEFYLAGDIKLDKFIGYLTSLSSSEYIKIYKNEECFERLMYTTAGLKSMIIGEDQILGQIKDAHEFSRNLGCCGAYLNTLFRIAVTGAKKVKTKTLLSKTPVSAATIAVKLCRGVLGTLKNKNVLIIGVSGKTGSAVLKNLASIGDVNIYATSRTRGGIRSQIDGACEVAYEKRYDSLDMCDAVISATSSPHLTLENGGIRKALRTVKKRIFIDLAVPRDICVETDEYTLYRNIDDLREIAEKNNRLKLFEARKAEEILREYIDRFKIWKLFYENRELFERVENKLVSEDEKRVFRHKIYDIKDGGDYGKFYDFVFSVKEGKYEY